LRGQLQVFQVFVPILGQNDFCTCACPGKADLGVPEFGALFAHLFFYKHDFIGTKSTMELLGDELLENWDPWIDFFV
jgi:hypothetical protein